jgi:hypothetical protein
MRGYAEPASYQRQIVFLLAISNLQANASTRNQEQLDRWTRSSERCSPVVSRKASGRLTNRNFSGETPRDNPLTVTIVDSRPWPILLFRARGVERASGRRIAAKRYTQFQSRDSPVATRCRLPRLQKRYARGSVAAFGTSALIANRRRQV